MLEKFCEAFDIEPLWLQCDYHKIYGEYCYKKIDCEKECTLPVNLRKTYRKISNELLVGLICILAKRKKEQDYFLEIHSTNPSDLQNEILEKAIYHKDSIKEDVQKLFKGY